jgi:PAS domain S-box-containing protein
MIVRRRALILGAMALLSLAVFVVDLLLPVGIEVWVLYLPVILAMVWLDNVRDIWIACAVFSAFVIVGVFISPPGANPSWWDLLNRGMGLAALWLMTFAAITIARRSRQIAETMEQLRVAIVRQEQADRALKKSEERLRLAAVGAGMGAWDLDFLTGKVIWSDTQFQMLGYRPTPGGDATYEMWLSRVHPDDRARVLEAQEQARRKQLLYSAEYRVRRPPGGDDAWLAAYGRYTYDESGEAVRFAGVSFDITQRKELEREVLEIAASEQQRIGQELHDSVGQEITGLALMANALTEKLPASDFAQQVANRLVVGLNRLHQQVRTLSQGLVPVQIEAHGLRAALHDLAARSAEQSNVRVSFDCRDRVAEPDHATATQLFRIAQEAVSNALRHGRPQVIQISLQSPDTGLRLQIQDDGTGLSPRAENGKGMGLRIMQYRAELIGGVLSVESNVGRGTTVVCSIPNGDRDRLNGRIESCRTQSES